MNDPVDPAFLRASDLFEHQGDEVLRAVLAQGRIEAKGAGEVLFRQGEAGDRLYIVKSGVLEVLASRDGAEAVPVAYLGEGEVLGELALLTGSPRSATVRAPERAEVLTLEQAVFLDLMATLPRFAQDLCAVLARRLEATTLKVPRQGAKQLQGNLRFFDLATVIQTLIGAQQTGTLTVTQDDGRQRVAELFFYKGNVAKAKVRHLSGDDAVFQLFQAPLEGDFSFTGRTVQEQDALLDAVAEGGALQVVHEVHQRAREAEEDRAELKNEMKELDATHRRELREARDREPEVEPGPPKDLTPPPEAGVATSPPPDATQSPPDLAPPTP